MTEPTYDTMPLGQMDAIDPYPFHGLVYRLISTGFASYLDPRDGRPAINLPPQPSVDNRYLPSYFSSRDGSLWDLGRADPPETPAILAAGGKALSRRILGRGLRNPVRLGDKTYQIEVLALPLPTGDTIQPINMSWRLYGSGAALNDFALITHADLGIDFEKLCSESGQLYIRPGAGVLSESEIASTDTPDAISADGTRWLFRFRGAINRAELGPARNIVLFNAGFVEVVFSLDEFGGIQATASVVKTIEQAVGTYSLTGGSALKTLGVAGSGVPSCTRSFALFDADPSATSASAGEYSLTRQRNDMIIGAVYVGSTVEYYRASQTYSIENSATQSRASYQEGIPDPPDAPTVCSTSGFTPSPTPIVASSSTTASASTTIIFESSSLTCSLGFTSSGSASDGVGSTSITSTSSAGSSISKSGGWVAPVIDKFGAFAPPPGSLVLPVLEAFQLGDHELVVVEGIRGWQSMVIAESTAAPSTVDLWRAPMLTPTGLVLDYVKQPSVPRGAYTYGGAYSPLTGDAARTGDEPGKVIEGFI